MKKVEILKNGICTNRTIVEDSEVDIFLHSEVFGSEEQKIVHKIIDKAAVLNDKGEETSPEESHEETETIPASYQVVITDLSAEIHQTAVNQEAIAYLASTDFYVVRLMDSGKPLPEGMSVLRQQARDKIVR
jgi:hypothetical protein